MIKIASLRLQDISKLRTAFGSLRFPNALHLQGNSVSEGCLAVIINSVRISLVLQQHLCNLDVLVETRKHQRGGAQSAPRVGVGIGFDQLHQDLSTVWQAWLACNDMQQSEVFIPTRHMQWGIHWWSRSSADVLAQKAQISAQRCLLKPIHGVITYLAMRILKAPRRKPMRWLNQEVFNLRLRPLDGITLERGPSIAEGLSHTMYTRRQGRQK
mmetsp:Transcript_2086/g.4503  ORF Transcript_2086/g.4503 Transcript_2086/m.4503 type:complete len:213 (-) Transcript_2086:23-661(-)